MITRLEMIINLVKTDNTLGSDGSGRRKLTLHGPVLAGIVSLERQISHPVLN